MKVLANLTLVKPSQDHSPLLESVGMQELVAEDVSSFEFNENSLIIHFNAGEDKTISLRGNDGQDNLDWRGATLCLTRKFLEIDLSK